MEKNRTTIIVGDNASGRSIAEHIAAHHQEIIVTTEIPKQNPFERESIAIKGRRYIDSQPITRKQRRINKRKKQ